MAGIRLVIDLFIPESVYTSISAAAKQSFVDSVRAMKTKATNFPGVGFEATWHRCLHDENKPCELKKDL